MKRRASSTREWTCSPDSTLCSRISWAARPRAGATDSDVTFFLNDGTQGLQFASVAGYVVRKAQELGVGREIPREWFTQNIRD